jgi:hypothetical protein
MVFLPDNCVPKGYIGALNVTDGVSRFVHGRRIQLFEQSQNLSKVGIRTYGSMGKAYQWSGVVDERPWECVGTEGLLMAKFVQ